MRRAFILGALTILGAFVAALAINVWVTWDYIIPDRPNEGRFLAPGLKFTLGWLEDGLVEAPTRDPVALGDALGVPVEVLSPDRARALSALPHLSIPLGAERFELHVDDLRDERFGVLHTGRGGEHEYEGALLITQLEGMSPFNRSTVPIWFGLSLLIGVAASPFIFVPLSRRLRSLEDTAKRLSAGELDARAPLHGPTHTLALALNTMADRTGRVLKSHEELLQAVAHELRTPTARIRFGVELMASVDDRADRQRRADDLDRDLSELDALVSELLSFARLGAEAKIKPREVVDVAALARAVVAEVAEGRPLEVVVVGGPALVEVEVQAMRRALRNLVMNALRFARQRIEVHVDAGERVVVAVDDDGPGVPEAERERIFAPFAVAEPSRTRGLGGVGLGLAIVRRITELHGGTVACTTAPLGGARLVTTWPAAHRRGSS